MGAARVAVAYSGGRDSTALLHATLRAAAPLGIAVVALHVHHGLSPNGDAWLEHCQAACARWARAGRAIDFVAERLPLRPPTGASVEAWARDARYAALHAMAARAGVSLVLLGHHQRDQAETFLLQALRGAGVAGLAAMPKSIERDGITWARPWLEQRREAIDGYGRRHRLRHVDDESNSDSRFARNRLRLQVWPQLVAAFPQTDAALAAAAARAHEAASALAELAGSDLAIAAPGATLDVAAWSTLSPARRSNALRAWLERHTGHRPPTTLVARLMDELPACRSARWPLAGGELRCHRGVASWHCTNGQSVPTLARETSLCIKRAGLYRLAGWGGAIRATRTAAGGLALATLAELELVPRNGAEQFQAGAGRPPRSLKKQFQMVGVPAWQRSGPLVCCAGRIVFVPGLGIDARALAQPGEPQLTLDWIGSDASR